MINRSMPLLAGLILLLVPFASGGQVVDSGDLAAHIDAIIQTMPSTVDGGQYLQPNLASRDLWRDIVDSILAGDFAAAHTLAGAKNYQVVLYTDTGGDLPVQHAILQQVPGSTSRYWGTFVFNQDPRRPKLLIQSPHPRFDMNTGNQGIRVFQETGALAFFLSGTHRCNGLTFSPCDGTTTVCSGQDDPYRYSDQAHVVDSTFQITLEQMLAVDPDLVVVQNHGFAKDSGDPYLIMSNGTRYYPSGTDYVVQIRNALQAIDPVLTAKVAHVDLSWTKLIATSNTQGRLLNGSSSPCGTAAGQAGGNFVHIEQAYSRLRDNQQNWLKLAQAIEAVIPDQVSGVPGSGRDEPGGFRLLGNFANPFSSSTAVVFELDREVRVDLRAYDLAGREVARIAAGDYPVGRHEAVWNARNLASGTYFLQLRVGSRTVTTRSIILR